MSGELSADGGDAEAEIARFTRAGVDDAALAVELQREGTPSFDASWNDLIECIGTRRGMVKNAAQAPEQGPR